MAGICSKHQHFEPGCRLCAIDIRDALPGYEKKLAEAKAAGEHTCEECGFVYFKTIDVCPMCYAPRPPEDAT
jgi:rubrerythrin